MSAPTSIFVTVGTELPFDRLVRAIDDWAGESGCGSNVFAQIGRTAFRPQHIRWSEMVAAGDFRRLFSEADLVIAHAGIGTILAALEQHRPLVVVPRRADLGEHRNDHQLATVKRFSQRRLIVAVSDEAELVARLRTGRFEAVDSSIGSSADPGLIDVVRAAIMGATPLRSRGSKINQS